MMKFISTITRVSLGKREKKGKYVSRRLVNNLRPEYGSLFSWIVLKGVPVGNSFNQRVIVEGD